MTDIDRRNVLQLFGAGLMAGLAGCGVGIFGDSTQPNKGGGDDENGGGNSSENGGEMNDQQ
jgi:hypothetical protein